MWNMAKILLFQLFGVQFLFFLLSSTSVYFKTRFTKYIWFKAFKSCEWVSKKKKKEEVSHSLGSGLFLLPSIRKPPIVIWTVTRLKKKYTSLENSQSWLRRRCRRSTASFTYLSAYKVKLRVEPAFLRASTR